MDLTTVKSRDPATFSVLLHLVDGFSMMALCSAIEPLRAANRLIGHDRYAWSVSARVQGQATASNGIGVATRWGSEDLPEADLTVVVASLFERPHRDPKLATHLRRLRARGLMIGAVSNGAWILAEAGLLGSRKVAIHWELARELERAFPEAQVSEGLYCWDRGVLTAAGGTAALDMMLGLIATLSGPEIAIDVADQFLHGPIRPADHGQRNGVQWRHGITDPRLLAAIDAMTGRIADPVRIADIAARVGISERQLERLFLSELGATPSDYYMRTRLQAARGMLIGSTETLEGIAFACGFSSVGHFSRSFKAAFGESPSVVRRRRPGANGGFMQAHGDRM